MITKLVSGQIRGAFVGLLLASFITQQCFGYGAAGHAMVGALAEARLSKESTTVFNKAKALLGGLSLEEAAMIPDQIRVWDKLPTADRTVEKVTDIQSLPGKSVGVRWNNPALRQAMWEYWKKNSGTVPNDGQQWHHVYHFTDISIAKGAPLVYQYDAKVVGKADYDIVHTLVDCVEILQSGKADTKRGITPQVAVVLICHFVGDLHQPLHVGAEYFKKGTATKVNPNGLDKNDFSADKGGNGISVPTEPKAENSKHTERIIAGASEDNLHSVWDKDAVEEAFAQLKVPASTKDKPQFLDKMASLKPAAGVLPSATTAPKDYFSSWAQEILPFAQQAHERLTFEMGTEITKKGKTIKVIEVAEDDDNDKYLEWAGSVVAAEIPKAGIRLAWVLEQALKKAP